MSKWLARLKHNPREVADTAKKIEAASTKQGIDPHLIIEALGGDTADLAPHEIEDFVRIVATRLKREAGQVPFEYTQAAFCRNCGPVWLFVEGTVDGCPWCENTANGWPVPRPQNLI